MATSSFVQRKIDVTVGLGTGAFGETGSKQVTLSGLRVSAVMEKAGGASMGSLQLRVYGLPLATMNQLSTIGLVYAQTRRNTVTVTAGDDQSGMATVFEGTIQDAWADFGGMPAVSFNIAAFAGQIEALVPVPPSSFQGTASVATIMAGLAKTMGLQFENSQNVLVQLSNPYFPGTARDQAMACAKAADIEWLIDNGTLAIWPKNSARGNTVPLISPQSGMVCYPAFSSFGVSLETLFMPSIVYGTLIKIQSDLAPACGYWKVFQLRYNLESQTPGGQWFIRIEAARPGFVPVV